MIALWTAASGAGLVAGMMRPAPLAAVHNAIKAGMERGRLAFGPADQALAACGVAAGFEKIAAPLLAQWQRAGLLTTRAGAADLTLAGRFWQVAMTARLIAWTDARAIPSTIEEIQA
ncbi:MAG TPA: hypothetical protein ENN83_08940 [Rhodovulum sp.]|nr:hypothetical protein [Rhodovulum sp.]